MNRVRQHGGAGTCYETLKVRRPRNSVGFLTPLNVVDNIKSFACISRRAALERKLDGPTAYIQRHLER